MERDTATPRVACGRAEPGPSTWDACADEYAGLIDVGSRTPLTESVYLRENAVASTVLGWLGDVSDKAVLDAGCGPGWLHQRVRAAEAFACDMTAPESVPDHVRFEIGDLRNLHYPDGRFDTVVCSLVLQWVDDLAAAYRELFRVTRPGGTLIVSATHPYFYRTFTLDDGGRPVITRPLGAEGSEPVWIGGTVGPFEHQWRRPTDYINECAAAGWRIDEMYDWFLDVDHYRAAGVTGPVARSGDVPMFMFMRATRP